MKSILTSLIFLFLIGFIFPYPAYGGYTMVPLPPIYQDDNSKNLSITIEATDSDSFAINVPYTFSAQADFVGACNVFKDIRTSDPKKITTVINLEEDRWGFTSCRDITGIWNLKLYIDWNKPLFTGSLLVEQAGGGIPSIAPKQSIMRVTSDPSITMVLEGGNKQNGYSVWWDKDPNWTRHDIKTGDINGTLYEFQLGPGSKSDRFSKIGEHTVCMAVGNYGLNDGLWCKYPTIVKFQEKEPEPPPAPKECRISPSAPNFLQPVSVIAANLTPQRSFEAKIINQKSGDKISQSKNPATSKDDGSVSITDLEPRTLPEGDYIANVYSVGDDNAICTTDPIHVEGPKNKPLKNCGEKDDKDKPIICGNSAAEYCKDGRGPAIKTAIGCIHTNPVELGKDLLKFGLGIGGGLSFLMMLFGAFQMMTSAGNPETLNTGRQRLTSAIIGLLFVILSILILQIIGWNILQLPGFGTK